MMIMVLLARHSRVPETYYMMILISITLVILAKRAIISNLLMTVTVVASLIIAIHISSIVLWVLNYFNITLLIFPLMLLNNSYYYIHSDITSNYNYMYYHWWMFLILVPYCYCQYMSMEKHLYWRRKAYNKITHSMQDKTWVPWTHVYTYYQISQC